MKLSGSTTVLATGVSCVCLALSATANPTAGVIIAGHGAIGPGVGSTLNINLTSSRSIINWNSFSIASGESTVYRFTGPSGARSAVLNEVMGGAPSQINGLLQSFVGATGSTRGGAVYLVNPNGIFIGASGQVSAGSFVASTLPVNNNSFLSGGPLSFSGNSTAAIQNEGVISVDNDVFLIAHNVLNSGAINGKNAGLAAGSEISLTEAGNPELSVIAGSGNGTGTGVANTASGQINAVTAQLKAAGGNIYALAINNAGVVRATGVTHKNGHIYLTADGGGIQNSGTLSADNASGVGGSIVVDGGHNAVTPSTVNNSGTITAAGAKGGTVQITGDEINLAAGSSVNVSGQTGGGTALIGGGPHGTDAAIQNAAQTTIAAGATVTADAGVTGNGGHVVVWGDTDQFSGSISAKGGARSGNGGLVEVSGHTLDFTGTANTTAPHGQIGTLLLDPLNLDIGAADDGQYTGTTTVTPITGVDSTSELSWATINGLLADNSVFVTTTGTAGPQAGNITITDPGTVATTSTHNLTLNAIGTLTVNSGATITDTGTGTLSLESGATMTIGADITGNILSLTSGGNINIGANLTAASASLPTSSSAASGSSAGFALTVAAGSSGTGNVSFNNSWTMKADSQYYKAGDGTGSSAYVDMTGIYGLPVAPTFVGNSTANPVYFTFRQDHQIDDFNVQAIPAGAQFGGGTPANYLIQSDGGYVYLTQPSEVAGSALTLVGNGTAYLGAGVTLGVTGTDGGGGLDFTSGGGGALASLNAQSTGSIAIYNSIEATAVAGISLHSGTGGAGNILFGSSGLTMKADAQSYQAGILDGSASAAVADLFDDAPLFVGESATLPSSFTFEQDATIGDGNIPAITQFGNGGEVSLGNMPYAIKSDGGNLTVSTAANVAGSALTLQADPGGNGTTTGILTIGGNLSLASLNATGAAINLDATGSSVTPTVTTSGGGQSYTGPISLSHDTVLADSGNGAITFSGTTTIDGNQALDVETGGTTTFGAAVGSATLLTSLTVDGTHSGAAIALNGGSITTTGDQDYAGAVTLGAATTLQSSTLELAGVTGAGFDLTLDNSAAVTLSSSITGVGIFTADGAGSLVVNTSIGANSIVDSEATTLNGTVTTPDDQDYTGTVTLAGATTLQSTSLELAGVTGAGFSLTLDNSLTATLNGVVSGVGVFTADGTGNLASGSTIGAVSLVDSENTSLGGNVTTTGDQDYTQAITLTGPVALQSSTLELAGVTGGGFNLALDNAALATLNGAVNGVGILTANGNGTGTLLAKSTIAGASVNDMETTTLEGNVTTTGDQDYAGTVTLGASITLQTSTLELAGVAGGGFNLTLNNSAAGMLNGAVAGVGALIANGGGLTANSAIGAASFTDGENTTLKGNVTTTGDQDYTGALTLGAATTLQSSTLELAGVTGAGFDLTLDNSAAVTLSSSITGVGIFTADGVGSLVVNTSIGANSIVDSEATTLNGTVTTPGDQDYTGTVTLAGATTLQSTSLELAGVTGAGFSLTLDNSLTATLNGVVSGVGVFTADGTGNLASGSTIGAVSLVDSENTSLGGNVTTTGDQDYTQAITLTGPVALQSSTLELAGVTGGGFNLALDNAALATLNGAVNGVGILTANGNGTGTLLAKSTIAGASVNDMETTTLEGNVTTTGDQDYAGTVTLGASITLQTSTLELAGVAGGGFNLTLNNSAAGMLNGAVAGVGALIANGGGLTANSAIGAASFTDGENTTLKGNVTTTGDQDYTGALTLGAATTLQSSTLELAGVTGAGFDLTLDNSAAVTLSSSITGVGIFTADGVGSLVVNTSIGANSIVDSEATTLNGTVTTPGDQDYTGTVTLAGATTLQSTSLELAGVTGAGFSLTLDNSLTATLNGVVSGVGVFTADGTGNLASGSTIGAVSLVDSENTSLGGNVTTTGDQDYTQAITLTGPVALQSSTLELAGVTGGGFNLALDNAALATLNGAVNGVGILTANGNGTGTLLAKSTIAEASVNDMETTTLEGNVTTTGDQDYAGTVTLGASITLQTSTLELAGVAGGGFNLTLNNSAAGMLNGAVAGVGALIANGGGLTVNSAIGAASFTDGENTTLKGNVTTTGDQDYTGALTLGATATLQSTTLELAGVTGGGFNLTLNNSAAGMLNGAVAGVGILTANGGGLTANSAIGAVSFTDNENTTLKGNVTTTGDQDYTGALTLGATVTLQSTTLELAGLTGGGNGLTLNNSGVGTLNGAINGLASLTANGSGSMTLDGGSVTTTGDQRYTELVTLGAPTILNSSTLELAGVTGAGFALTLNNSSTANLSGAISGVGAFKAEGTGSLSTASTITANSLADSETTSLGGNVTTTGDQAYTGAITLTAPMTLQSSTLELAEITGGNNNLTLNNSSTATLSGTISGVGTLTANGGGALAVNNNIAGTGSIIDSEATTLNGAGSPASESITTTGSQNYTGSLTLGAPTTLNGTTLSLAAVTGAGFNLTLNNSLVATLAGSVNGVGALKANGGGLVADSTIGAASVNDTENTTLNGNVTTSGDQNYTKGMTLAGSVTLQSSTLELAAVNGSQNLTLDNSRDATLNAEVDLPGSTTLTINGTGSILTKNNITVGDFVDNEPTTISAVSGIVTITDTASPILLNNSSPSIGSRGLVALPGQTVELVLNDQGVQQTFIVTENGVAGVYVALPPVYIPEAELQQPLQDIQLEMVRTSGPIPPGYIDTRGGDVYRRIAEKQRKSH